MKHRILGIIVIAAVAVLAYPFMTSKDLTTEAYTLTEAPPFPDESVQVSSVTVEETIKPADDAPPSSDKQAIPLSEDKGVDGDKLDGTVQQQPDGTIEQNNQEMVIDINVPELIDPPEIPNNATSVLKKMSEGGASNSSGIEITENGVDVREVSEEAGSAETAAPSGHDITSSPATKKVTTKPKKTKKHVTHRRKVHIVKHKRVHASKRKATRKTRIAKPIIYSKLLDKRVIPAYQKMPLNENGLLSLKESAYVIQMGSFKVKANALRLVNQLRSKGYRAFIQKYATASGNHTRVFVGPEKQKKSARIVAAELRDNVKIRGIVISYKPYRL